MTDQIGEHQPCQL